ncbi:hypothetical protein [Hymenobacter arizonensis]|uniref:Helix-turn-helix domain-containing protein n=1 Tax=Hymenobacter arizonensis TaxID=1227077 RepID=A0A1I5T9R0_HYMAR|nr:hypothetical protein [Hymenobacter arizonensis]SFP79397.1 hypothetical protein SAMN04515668_0365 [Hymenobacter arizonensis]
MPAPLPDYSFVPASKSEGLTIPGAVLALPVSPAAKFVLAELLALHSRQPTPGPLAVGNDYLARRLQLTLRTVGLALRELFTAGHLAHASHPTDRRFRLLTARPPISVR